MAETTERGSRIPGTGRLAIILSAGCILLPVAAGLFFAGILKRMNPAGIDVTQPLAYLTEILIFSWIAIGVCIVAAFLADLRAMRSDPVVGRIAFWVWGMQIGFGVLLFVANLFSTVAT